MKKLYNYNLKTEKYSTVDNIPKNQFRTAKYNRKIQLIQKRAQYRLMRRRENKVRFRSAKNISFASHKTNLKIISVNLNDPASQLGRLETEYGDANIICVNELNIDPDMFYNKRCFRAHFDAYHHEPVIVNGKQKVFSAILVRNNQGIVVDQVYNKAPFTSLKLTVFDNKKEIKFFVTPWLHL